MSKQYEIHLGPFPSDSSISPMAAAWMLYETGDGGFDLIGWFTSKEDAEFAQFCFETRDKWDEIAKPMRDAIADSVQLTAQDYQTVVT